MTDVYGLSSENVENLDLLATYLENLPEDYEHFEMSLYADLSDSNERLLDYMQNNGGLYDKCGTVGCALGHGPSAGVLASGDELEASWNSNIKQVNWSRYSKRFVSIDADNAADEHLWDFFFAANWSEADNSHRGAAARIRFILDGNRIPSVFFYTSFDDDDYVSQPDRMKETVPHYQEYLK